jgi:hypothetical protein
VRRLAAELGDELCVGLRPDPAPVLAALGEQEQAAGRQVRRSVLAPFVAAGASGSALVGHPRDLNVAGAALQAQLGVRRGRGRHGLPRPGRAGRLPAAARAAARVAPRVRAG